MDFRFTPDEQAFHKEVQDFINQLLPKDWIGVDPDGHNEQADEKLHQVDLQGRKALAAKGGWGSTGRRSTAARKRP